MYTETRLRKSVLLRLPQGYTVLSPWVAALIYVAMLLFTISMKGSFTGYPAEPFRTVCSMIWGTPVSS